MIYRSSWWYSTLLHIPFNTNTSHQTENVKQTLFIADLHLGESTPDITHCFVDYLNAINPEKTDALYVLGDLFEVWIGDDEITDFTNLVAKTFKSLSDKGIPVFFIHGNRDFLLRKKFAKRAGITLLPEQHVIDLYGEKAVILHGDQLCTRDVEYQKFRKKARSWWWPNIILMLPLSVRQKIARKGREKSKNSQANLSQDIMDVTPEEVITCLTAHKVNLMIHGHTHRPAFHDIEVEDQPAQRIVLGDWYQQGSVLVVTPERKELQQLPFSQVAGAE